MYLPLLSFSSFSRACGCCCWFGQEQIDGVEKKRCCFIFFATAHGEFGTWEIYIPLTLLRRLGSISWLAYVWRKMALKRSRSTRTCVGCSVTSKHLVGWMVVHHFVMSTFRLSFLNIHVSADLLDRQRLRNSGRELATACFKIWRSSRERQMFFAHL